MGEQPWMSKDLLVRLRWWAFKFCGKGERENLASDDMSEAADSIEKLEAVTKDDAKWLATYHKWCEMNGCAPSSSDLISARKALEEKDD